MAVQVKYVTFYGWGKKAAWMVVLGTREEIVKERFMEIYQEGNTLVNRGKNAANEFAEK